MISTRAEVTITIAASARTSTQWTVSHTARAARAGRVASRACTASGRETCGRSRVRRSGLRVADEIGPPPNLAAVSRAFNACAHAAGLPGVTLHSLWHSFATWALTNGYDVKTVSTILGHSAALTALNVYGHVVAGLQDLAVQGTGETLALARARRAAAENAVPDTARQPNGNREPFSGKAMREKPRKITCGEVAERLNAAVLKTARPAKVSGVRISSSPRNTCFVPCVLRDCVD